MAEGREIMIDYWLLRGRQNETVVNEHSVVSINEAKTFRFKSPSKMVDHGLSENSLNWSSDI